MFKLRDVTEDAKEVVKCVRQLTSSPRSNYTLLHFVELFKGEQTGELTRMMDVPFVVLQDLKTCASLVSTLLSCRFSRRLHHRCPFFLSSVLLLFFSLFLQILKSTCIMGVPLVSCRFPNSPHRCWYVAGSPKLTHHLSYLDILQDLITLTSWMSQLLFCKIPKLAHHLCPT